MAPDDRFDPYGLLGVTRSASDAEIARAYRATAKRVHPDLHGPDASRQMRDLNRAFHILSDADRRRAWDQQHAAAGRTNPHWNRDAVTRVSSVGPSSPRAWAAWEASRPTASPAGRVGVAEGWPRAQRTEARAASGMRDSAWLAVAVAAVLVIALLVLGWIAARPSVASRATQAFAALGISPTVTLALDGEHEVAVYRASGGGLGLATAERDGSGWSAGIRRVVATTRANSVIAVELGFGRWETIVFGRAGPGTERVRLPGVDGRGGEVSDGMWVIGLAESVRAEDLDWEFVGADGVVLGSGSGGLDR